MGKKNEIESMILSNRIVLLNWDSKQCLICKDQNGTLRDIVEQVQLPEMSLFNVDYSDNKKKFTKLGNVLLPSLNVFVDGKQLDFIDTKMNPRKKIGFFKKKERIVDKKVGAISGKRSKADLMKIVEHAMREML